MSGKKILLTTLEDPLQCELALQYLRNSDDTVYGVCLTAESGQAVEHLLKALDGEKREQFVLVDDYRALEKSDRLSLEGQPATFDVVWHSTVAERSAGAELEATNWVLGLVQSYRIPVVNLISNERLYSEQLQSLSLLQPQEPVESLVANGDRQVEFAIRELRESEEFCFRIFRPCNLLVAEANAGLPANGFYNLLSSIVNFKQEIEAKAPEFFSQHPIRVRGDLSGRLLDIKSAGQIIFDAANTKDTCNGVFNVVGSTVAPLETFLKELSLRIGTEIGYVRESEPKDAVDELIEAQLSGIYQQLQRYDPQPGLDQTGFLVSTHDAGLPQSEREIIEHFLSRYASRREAGNAGVNSFLERRTVEFSEGELLHYYAGGTGERTIVIVNAYGQGLVYWDRLLAKLAANSRVIVWLPRGTDFSDAGVQKNSPVAVHRDDLRRIVAHEGVGPATFLGWCTGAKLILDYYSQYSADVSSMIFLSATFKNVPDGVHLDTEFERGLEPLLKMVQQRPQLAGRLIDSLQAVMLAGKSVIGANGSGAPISPTELKQLLAGAGSELEEAVIGPFASEESIVEYTAQIIDFWNQDATSLFNEVRVPVLFVHGECDRIASAGGAQTAAQVIPGARYVEIKGGSHYLQHEKSLLLASIVENFGPGITR